MDSSQSPAPIKEIKPNEMKTPRWRAKLHSLVTILKQLPNLYNEMGGRNTHDEIQPPSDPSRHH